MRSISLSNDVANIGNGKLHCMLGYDLIPNSPESATLYDESSVLSTRPDSLESILFDANKKIGNIDDTNTYCVMNELDCFGNEENRNLQIGIDDMYQQMNDIDQNDKISITDFDTSKVIKTFADDEKLAEPRYAYELGNLQAFMCGDANLNSASRSYTKSIGCASTAINIPMLADAQYYTANTNGSHNATSITTNNDNQLFIINNKSMQSANGPIDANQFLTTKMSGPTTALEELNSGRLSSNDYVQDHMITNDFDISFDLNTYDLDDTVPSRPGSHLAFACEPTSLGIPRSYLATFNNIQNSL